MLVLMLMLVLQVFVSMGTSLGIGGRARVAREGVNCTISGSYAHRLTHARPRTSVTPCRFLSLPALQQMVSQLQTFHKAFLSTDFKFIKDLAPSQHFPQLNVFPVKELVTYGIREAEQAPLSQVTQSFSARAL